MIRKFFIFILILVCIFAGGLFYLIQKADIHHTKMRLAWKNVAIQTITTHLKDPDHLKKSFSDNSEWLTPNTILNQDASWLVYQSQCHKIDPEIHDIFIAKASNGKWYYSDFHFCKNIMALEADGQPRSLDSLKYQYFLVEFDGKSDEALKPTWIPNGELRYNSDTE